MPQPDPHAAQRRPASIMFAMCVLARRDMVRFVRQPARILAAIGTPLLLWALVGSGFAGAFKPAALSDTSYRGFILPGMLTLSGVFASIFSAISIIEDRNEGWLQGVLVSPVPRTSIALGKIIGGAVIAFVQAAALIPLLPLSGEPLDLWSACLLAAALALTCVATTGLGVAFAWLSETTAGFHAVMNLVFMPMWLLSGAFFPPTGASPWLGWIMRLNPLTWCTQAIRAAASGKLDAPALGVSLLFASVTAAAAIALVMRPASSARR